MLRESSEGGRNRYLREIGTLVCLLQILKEHEYLFFFFSCPVEKFSHLLDNFIAHFVDYNFVCLCKRPVEYCYSLVMHTIDNRFILLAKLRIRD